ncbi:seryl-tRNA synthetase [bacterium SM23_31]|nr:MAG: seryl-tRNA synthetase [bacterium SM23_31]
MLDLKFIRENPELVSKGLKNKGYTGDLTVLLDLDMDWRKLLEKADELKQRRNVVSRQIAEIKRKNEDSSELVVEMQSVAKQIKEYDEKINRINNRIYDMLFELPNVPHNSAPVGDSAEENRVVRHWGKKPDFDFPLKDHYTLGHSLGMFDFMRASKITGAGFPLYKGPGARLERALINFMLDLHTEKHGYSEIYPPFLTNRNSTGGTGQLPKLEDDMYRIPEEDLFLIPTAEVPVTNIYKNEILKYTDLPINHVAFSACFRREAGSYGKDTRGFQRVHQFNKVELVKFVPPETSYDELEILLNHAEEVLKLLDLHYRVVELCTGDLSFAAAKCYDIEVWAPAEEKYLEVSSCSNFENFQARRIGIRFRRQKGAKVEYVHTLNGSGVATPRLLIALMETYQTDEGSVIIPEVLRPYTKFSIIKQQ